MDVSTDYTGNHK